MSAGGLPLEPSAGTQPGWRTDPARPNESLFWDGQRWSARRRWSPTGYQELPLVSEPVTLPKSKAPQQPRTRRATILLVAAVVVGALLAGGLVIAVVHHHSKSKKSPSASGTQTSASSLGTDYDQDAGTLARRVPDCEGVALVPGQQANGIVLQSECAWHGHKMRLYTLLDRQSEVRLVATMEQDFSNYAAGKGWVATSAGSLSTADQLQAGRAFVDALGGSYYEIKRPATHVAESLARDDGAPNAGAYVSAVETLVAECGVTEIRLAALVDAALLVGTLSGLTGQTRLTLMQTLQRLVTAAGSNPDCQSVLTNYVVNH